MTGYFECKSTKTGAYRFNLKAGNHQVVLTSENYNSKAAALNGIRSVQENATSLASFDRRKARDGSPYFVLKAGNGEIIGRSEMYRSTSSMENGIASVRRNAPGAHTKDLTA